MRLCWHKRTADEVESSIAVQHKLKKTTQLPTLSTRYPFELEIPRGPYSFEMPQTGLTWTLEVSVLTSTYERSEISRAVELIGPEFSLDHAQSDTDMHELQHGWRILAPITKMPITPEAKFEWLQYIYVGPYEMREPRNAIIIMILYIVTIGLGLYYLIPAFLGPKFATLSVPRQGLILLLYAVLALIVISVLIHLYKAQSRHFLIKRTLGPIDFELTPEELLVGDTTSLSVSFCPRRDIRITRVHAQLRCEMRADLRGQSIRAGSSAEVTPSSKKAAKKLGKKVGFLYHKCNYELLSAPIELRSGQTFAVVEALPIPADAPSSYFWRAPFWLRILPISLMLKLLERKWIVRVQIEADGIHDWISEFKFLVYPYNPGDRLAEEVDELPKCDAQEITPNVAVEANGK